MNPVYNSGLNGIKVNDTTKTQVSVTYKTLYNEYSVKVPSDYDQDTLIVNSSTGNSVEIPVQTNKGDKIV